LDDRTRSRILEYVKPLAAGLDGMANYGDVERAVAAAEAIAAEARGADGDLLFLLAVFSGQEKWVSRMGHGSRTEIFLESLGLPRRIIAALFRGLSRFQTSPQTLEEEIVHDAVALDSLGAYGIARGLAEAYRERLDMLEMAAAIEEAAARPLCTEAGRLLASPRRQAMLDFAARLRAEHAQFGRPA
jgi:hypothetical protein